MNSSDRRDPNQADWILLADSAGVVRAPNDAGTGPAHTHGPSPEIPARSPVEAPRRDPREAPYESPEEHPDSRPRENPDGPSEEVPQRD